MVKFDGGIIDESAPEGQKIDVFYDNDERFDNSVKVFASGLKVDETVANLNIDAANSTLAEGTYRIGAAMFTTNCAVCHPGIGPDLIGTPAAEVIATLEGGHMSAGLTEEEIAAIADYVASQ